VVHGGHHKGHRLHLGVESGGGRGVARGGVREARVQVSRVRRRVARSVQEREKADATLRVGDLRGDGGNGGPAHLLE